MPHTEALGVEVVSALTGTGLVTTIISIVVAAVIVASMFPVLDSSLADLTKAAQNSTNPLLHAIAPALPYIVGLILLGLIFYIVESAIDRIHRR